MNETKLTIDEEMFISKLSVGIENAKTAKAIGMHDRTIRRYVETLREKRVPICSHNCGYWIAENLDEAQATIRRMEATAYSTLNSAQALRDCFS